MKWMFLGVLSLYLVGNAYIFVRLIQNMTSWPLVAKVLFGLLFWTASIALFASIALRDAGLPSVVHHILFGVGSLWLVFTLYMVMSLIVADLIHLALPSFRGGVWYALAVTLAILVCGYINYRNPRVEHLDIELTTRPLGRPMRIVAISDVHLGYGTDRKDLARYVDMINDECPDLLLIVGDLIDNSVEPVEREDMCAEFSRVHAPEGIYMVAGNHEYISGIEAVERYLATTSIRLLRDSVEALPSGLQLLCRDDRMNRHRESLESLLRGADSSRPTLLLDHQPYDISESAASGSIDIHLSGHTHRGQVWPLTLLTDALYEQSYGYRRWADMHAYVSSGLSLWGPPFRIGSRSEMVVIDIK